MCFSAVCASIGQLVWKLSALSETPFLFYIIGFVLYGIGAVLMIIAYRFGELSILQPMLSVGFILAIVLGYIILNEPITYYKLAGISIIIIGLIFLGLGGKHKEKSN